MRELARVIHFIQDLCASYSWGLYHKPMTIKMLQKLRWMADEAIARVYGSYIFSEAEWLMPYVEYGREDIAEFLEGRMYYY